MATIQNLWGGPDEVIRVFSAGIEILNQDRIVIMSMKAVNFLLCRPASP